MSTKILRESVAEAPVKAEGNRFRVVVARPGAGSSGNYTAELFERDGAAAMVPGAQAFLNHDTDRNPKDMIGFYPEGARWDADENALVADLQVFSHWKDFVEEVYPHVGMSLYMLGEADEDGNITRLIPDPLNGCDMVARPGLVGSGIAEKLYEAAHAQTSEHKPGASSAQEDDRKESAIMDAEIAARFDALDSTLNSLVAERHAEAEASAQAAADTQAVEAAIAAYEAARDAIDAAELLDSQADSLKAEARKGTDVTALIEQAKTIRDEALASVQVTEAQTQTQGRFVGSSTKYESATDLGKVFG